MAVTNIKKPIDEEAHWRIDEHERRLSEIPSLEHIQAAFTGMLSMCMEEIKREIGKSVSATKVDSTADKELTTAVKELIELLKAPRKRTLTANLPSGPITVTTDVH
jgi:hypothetical protein